MAVERSYARLGLFIVITLLVVIATALFFIQRLRSRAVITYVTYTTENVSGLDVSSPVRYRGVPIGRVSAVRVDPGITNIEIVFEVFEDRLQNFGVNVKRVEAVARQGIFEKTLRTQVVSNPVTGEAYLLIDRPANPPPPMSLGFSPKLPYVPSMPTSVSTLQERMPAMMDRVDATLQSLRLFVAKIGETLERSDRFYSNFEKMLPVLNADSRNFLNSSNAQLAQIGQIVSEMNKLNYGDMLAKAVQDTHASIENTRAAIENTRVAIEDTRAIVRDANLPATTQSAREALDRTAMAADALRRSLPAIQESLAPMRDLAKSLENQPESIVFGPRSRSVKSK
jgi:paraquat-inducible protein B